MPAAVAPADVEDGDAAVVGEVRELRRDLVTACLRADRRAELARQRADEDADAFGDLLAEVGSLGTEDHPLRVSSVDDAEPVTGTVALSAEDRAGLSRMWDTWERHWWFWVGGVCALVAVGGFFWAVRPDR